MKLVRLTTGFVLAYVLALGASAACASGEEKSGPAAPPPDPSTMLDAGLADVSQPDVVTPVVNECSDDGFCYVPVPSAKPLIAVSASSADDAWMLSEESGAILRWNGASIEQLYEYDGASPSSITFVDLWAAKKDDVWAAAKDSESRLFFVHYATRSGGAAAFRELATTEPVAVIRALWGTPAGDQLFLATESTVLRVREDASGAVVEDLHPNVGAEDDHGYSWSGTWGFGADDVFVAGKICPASPCGEESQGAIAHYDGTSWTIATLGSTRDVSSLRGTPPGTERQLWYDATEEDAAGKLVSRTHLALVNPENKLAADLYTHPSGAAACGSRIGQATSASAGWFSSGGLLCHWNGSKLEPARTAVAERPLIGALRGIWAGGADDVWLVGAAVARTGLPQGAVAARRTATTPRGQQ